MQFCTSGTKSGLFRNFQLNMKELIIWNEVTLDDAVMQLLGKFKPERTFVDIASSIHQNFASRSAGCFRFDEKNFGMLNSI